MGAGMPLPQGGPTPPQNSNHQAGVTPTQQQQEGVRQALNERSANIQGQNSSMLQQLSPMNPPLDVGLGGSPY